MGFFFFCILEGAWSEPYIVHEILSLYITWHLIRKCSLHFTPLNYTPFYNYLLNYENAHYTPLNYEPFYTYPINYKNVHLLP